MTSNKKPGGDRASTTKMSQSYNFSDSESITSMLSFISPYEREIWVKMAMGIKAELGDSGFHVFDNWSREAGKSYNQKSAKAVWKSVKATGGISIGTLIFMAKQNGWKPDKPIKRLSAKEVQRRQKEREKAEQAAQEVQIKNHEQCAKQAVQDTERARPANAGNPYLISKEVLPFGLLEDAKSLLMPLSDINGKIWNHQRIYRKSKFFIKNGRVSGLFYQIGEVSKPDGVIRIGEGFATMATIAEIVNDVCVVALFADNLLPVCLAFRKKYPLAEICVTGDNDRNTKGNPGRTKAILASAAVSGSWVIPDFPDDAPKHLTDFNDWANYRRQGNEKK